jgi:hypothetical protein
MYHGLFVMPVECTHVYYTMNLQDTIHAIYREFRQHPSGLLDRLEDDSRKGCGLVHNIYLPNHTYRTDNIPIETRLDELDKYTGEGVRVLTDRARELLRIGTTTRMLIVYYVEVEGIHYLACLQLPVLV